LLDGPGEILNNSWQDRELDGYILDIRDFKKGRTERETYFNIYLRLADKSSIRPIIQGLYFMGRGDYIKAWVEFRYMPQAEFAGGGSVDLEKEGLTGGLFSILGKVVPPGGSMMVIYGAEAHPLMVDTESGLKRSYPPAVTPLGYHLWNNGFRWFKDWYFPEGWMEGGMKLQATRPLTDDIRKQREGKALLDLDKFVSGRLGQTPTRLGEEALIRARDILASLR
jgi:hypothetical protein